VYARLTDTISAQIICALGLVTGYAIDIFWFIQLLKS